MENNKVKLLKNIIPLITIIFTISGCFDMGRDNPYDRKAGSYIGFDRIEVAPATSSVKIGKTQQFSATLYDKQNVPIENVDFIWESSDQTVATIDDTGLATVIKDGTVSFTASALGVTSDSIPLNIAGYKNIMVSPVSTTVKINGTKKFTAALYDEDGDPVNNVSFTWSSSDDTVATIDSDGILTVLKDGNVTVTASALSLVSDPVTVNIAGYQNIVVTPSSSTVKMNNTQQFTAVLYDEENDPVEGVTFTWNSSNNTLLTVDSTGLATGKLDGSVTITASALGLNSSPVSITVATDLGTLFNHTNGPAGGTCKKLLSVSSSTLFAGYDSGGLYKSTNGGVTWQLWGDFLGKDITALAYDGTYIYVGTTYDTDTYTGTGITRINATTAGSWENYNATTVSRATINDMRYFNGKLYASITTGTTEVNRVYVSEPGVTPWTNISNGLTTSDNVIAFADDGTYIYAADDAGKVYQYSGTAWVQMGAALSPVYITDLLYYNSTLYAVCLQTNLYAWSGTAWNALTNTGLPGGKYTALTGYGTKLIVGSSGSGAYISDSLSPTSWTRLGSSTDDIVSKASYDFAFSSNKIITATTAKSGIYSKYITSPTTAWNESGNGIVSSNVNDIFVNDQYVFAATDRGVYFRPSSGGFWSKFGDNHPVAAYSIIIVGDYIYAGVSYGTGIYGVFRVPLQGGSWERFGSGIDSEHIKILYSDGTYLYTGRWSGTSVDRISVNADPSSAWTTSWGGATPNGSNGFFNDGTYLYTSTSYGTYWKPVNSGSWTILGTTYTSNMTALDSDGTYLYAGTMVGLVKRISLSGLGDWGDFGSGLPSGCDISKLFIYGNSIFVGIEGYGVYRANLSDGVFTKFGSGYPSNTIVKSMTRKNSTIYLGTDAMGLWSAQ